MAPHQFCFPFEELFIKEIVDGLLFLLFDVFVGTNLSFIGFLLSKFQLLISTIASACSKVISFISYNPKSLSIVDQFEDKSLILKR